jgi:hypothetical protein
VPIAHRLAFSFDSVHREMQTGGQETLLAREEMGDTARPQD